MAVARTKKIGLRQHWVLNRRIRIYTVRKGRQRLSLLVEYLNDTLTNNHTNHLAARMIWREVFWRTSILEGWWFGVVWTRWSSIFSKHPFRQVDIIITIFFKSSWFKISPSKQQQWPLPYLMYLSFFYVLNVWTEVEMFQSFLYDTFTCSDFIGKIKVHLQNCTAQCDVRYY